MCMEQESGGTVHLMRCKHRERDRGRVHVFRDKKSGPNSWGTLYLCDWEETGRHRRVLRLLLVLHCNVLTDIVEEVSHDRSQLIELEPEHVQHTKMRNK